VLVLERREPAAVDTEPAPQHDVHRVGGGGPVEGSRHRGAPVDDDGVAHRVGDVPTADVQHLFRAAGRVEVDATEEEGRARVVGQRRDAPGEHPAQHLTRDRVTRPARVERLRRGAHPGQLGTRVVEVGLLERELRGGRGAGGHDGAPRARRVGANATAYARDAAVDSLIVAARR
jgi:hypothetical protein